MFAHLKLPYLEERHQSGRGWYVDKTEQSMAWSRDRAIAASHFDCLSLQPKADLYPESIQISCVVLRMERGRSLVAMLLKKDTVKNGNEPQ